MHNQNQRHFPNHLDTINAILGTYIDNTLFFHPAFWNFQSATNKLKIIIMNEKMWIVF